jgi:predicted anti-sigma-YlaC factor YlaD
MICEFTFDDGAYVLGALGPSERAAFERHLPACGACRESVSALAVLPGLLGRLDAATAVPPVAAPPSLLGRTLAAASARRRAERRRRVRYAFAGGLAAAVFAVAIGFGVHVADGGSATAMLHPPLNEMSQAARDVPVTAGVGLVATEGGTRVDMTCRYAEGHDGKWLIRLVVYPRWGGDGEQIGTWTATAGQELTLSGITHLLPTDIQRVELQRADATTLLTWSNV